MRWLTVILLWLMLLPAQAQQMQVTNFRKLWKGPLNIKHVVTEKRLATLDLMTSEKGFTFLADGVTQVQAEEGEGMLTLKVPHKTSFLLIKHDDFWQLFWKVPSMKLKKRRHYVAQLLTNSPDKDYKLQSQWVVFDIKPENAVVFVDSTQTATRNGRVQMELALGKHPYMVVSPFYEQQEGVVEVSDTEKQTIEITLQPIYAYLTVKTPQEGGEILVDSKSIGFTEATSGRLAEGTHHLIVMKDDVCWYEADVEIGKAEKKVLVLSTDDFYPRWRKKAVDYALAEGQEEKFVADRSVIERPAGNDDTSSNEIKAKVTITAPNDSIEILINKDLVGTGKWEGQLEKGFYAISTRMDGIESAMQYLWIEDDSPQEMNLSTAMADYGYLNIHCNVVGADIYINGVASGQTPCMTEKLLAGRTYNIRLSKSGFRDVVKQVKVLGNTLTDVKLKMKKKKRKS